MTNNLKISVITPSYNSGDSIERAIKSVLQQDYKNWEHWIVDGGSTDNTLNILKKYPHLKWISEKDNGQSDAMNKGFIKSDGDIIVYLNADDFFLSGAFSSVIKKFTNGAKFVVGDILVKNEDQNIEFINTPRITLAGMLRNWEPNAFCHNPIGYFYLREVQKRCPFNINNSYSMDLEFLLDAASIYNFTKINTILGCFCNGKNTKTNKSQSKINYWQPATFPYIEKHLNIFSDQEKELYYQDRLNGYVSMQENMSKSQEPNLLPLDSIPLITFIIPTYNDSQHICRSIDSVLSQDLNNIQIIVINDASTDDTQKVLRKYVSNKQIKIINNKKNVKLGASRNIGIKKAKGKYVFFLDSDDWIEPETIHHMASVAETYQADIVACGIKKSWDNGQTEKYHSFSFGCRGGIEALDYYSCYKIGSVVWNKLYQRDLITKSRLRFISPHWHEDIIFTAQAIYHCHNYISIPNQYYNYFQRNESIVNTKPTILHLRSYIRLFVDLSEFIKKMRLRASYHGQKTAEKLIQYHAINSVLPNLNRYINSHRETWPSDFLTACNQELGDKGIIVGQLIVNLLNIPFQLTDITSPSVDQFAPTKSEVSLLKKLRKLKHKIMPQDSFQKSIVDKLIKQRSLFL